MVNKYMIEIGNCTDENSRSSFFFFFLTCISYYIRQAHQQIVVYNITTHKYYRNVIVYISFFCTKSVASVPVWQNVILSLDSHAGGKVLPPLMHLHFSWCQRRNREMRYQSFDDEKCTSVQISRQNWHLKTKNVRI